MVSIDFYSRIDEEQLPSAHSNWHRDRLG